MGIHRRHADNEVAFLGGHADDSLAAPVLGGVNVRTHPLDIALPRKGDHGGMPFDQVLRDDLVRHRRKLGPAVVAVFIPDGKHLVLNNFFDLVLVRKDRLQLRNRRAQLGKSVFDLFPLQTRQSAQRHFHDRLRLHVTETEGINQVLLRAATFSDALIMAMISSIWSSALW